MGGIKRRDGPVGSLLQDGTVWCNLEGFSSGLDVLDTDLGWAHKKIICSYFELIFVNNISLKNFLLIVKKFFFIS